MPTPIGHTLSGALVYSFLPEQVSGRLKIFLMIVLLSMLPDIDIAFGFLVGRPNLYHHQFTHSIFFVLVTCMFAALIFKKNKSWFWRLTILFAGAGLMHLVMDMLTLDSSEPRGMQLFWPFTAKYYIAPVAIFSDVWRSPHSSQFFQSLFNLHNLRTVAIEIIFLGPFTAWAYWRRNLRETDK